MAFVHIGALGNANSGGVSDDELSMTVTEGVAAGDLVMVSVAKDNVQTTDGVTNEVTSVTDSKGNTYTKAGEYCNGEGAAAAGAVVATFFSRITTPLVDSVDTITAHFSANVTAAVINAGDFSVDNPVQVAAGSLQGVADDVDPSSMVISGLPSKQYLFVRRIAREAFTGASFTPTSGFTSIPAAGYDSGVTETNISLYGEFIIETGTGKTSDPSTSSDPNSASIFFALEEVVASTRRVMVT